VDIAGVADSEIIWLVSDLGPDVKDIGALLLAARERVGSKAKRMTRGAAGPHRVREQRQVPASVSAQVALVVFLVRDLIGVSADEPLKPGS